VDINIKKILIANRSEIASRIQASCQKLGIKTVAIYSPQDQFLKYVHDANCAFPLSKDGIAAYLDQDEILNIAKKANVDAITPGYGFLSENGQFAQKVIDAGFIWVGPNPKIINLMGDKITARKLMEKIEVPVIPGFYLPATKKGNEEGKKFADKIGYPILLKDPLAGGGRGMQKVENKEQFDDAWQLVNVQSEKVAGSNHILLEKQIKNGRHVEIQICGDGKNFVHLYERECSIQRRHQKIIEETPCNFVNKKTLEKMYNAAILAAKSVNYNNIGTVEFIVTQEEKFYFLEINPRLQVEHSITEMTTGIDLVETQLQITQSGKLPFTQNQISRKNHSIECRIYAENVQENFTPSTGVINNLEIPSNPFCRIDHNLEEKTEITPFFDPMIGKVTTFGADRSQAIKNMLTTLSNFKISVIKTNLSFLKEILKTEQFENGQFHTQTLNNKDYFKKLLRSKPQLCESEEIVSLIGAMLLLKLGKQKNKSQNQKQTLNHWQEQKWK